ncbi:TusE/DsrC/DsvC family sulfur relay protein [Chloroflexota bacterium]
MNKGQEMPTPIPEIDEDGFLIDSEKWSREIAEILAQKDVPQGLTEDHWTVVAFMRDYYQTFGTVPPVRMLSRRTNLSLRRIKLLFPSGLTKGACKIAGIPMVTIRPNFLYP